tara:strand:+ start:2631 stop:3086 length:456 start_codon:yes stop_codon:yes gene_type:complete
MWLTLIPALATIIGVGAQIKGAKQSGKIGAQMAETNAKQALIDVEQNKLEIAQFNNDRTKQLDNDLAAAEAFFAFSGRDMDASIQAYQDNERDVAYTDIARGTVRSVIGQGQALGQAQQGIFDAKNERRTASLKAAGYLAQGMYGLSTIIG